MRLPLSRDRKEYDHPHYDLDRVHSLARHNAPRVTIEGRALAEARRALPDDLVSIDEEIACIIGDLQREEFEYRQKKPGMSWADIYRVDFEGQHIYLKLKIEPDPETGEDSVAVLSFKSWTD